MMFFHLTIAALLGFSDALRPTTGARQLNYHEQRQDSGENLWDRIDVNELDKQLAAWHNEPEISGRNRPVIGVEEIEGRQGYGDIPRPIPPVQALPTSPQVPVQPPHQGCLAPRGQFPSPRSCSHYLNCWDDVVVEQLCPGGLLFNELISACDFEYNTYCAGRPGLPPAPELPPGSKRCPDPNGRYRSSTNCSEFYVCVYGRPVKYSCPRGVVYNEELGVCDFPYRVDCRGASVPQPSQPPTRPPTRPQPRPPQHPPQQPQQPQYPQPPQQPQHPQYPQPPQQPQYPTQQPQYPPQQPQYPPQQPQYPPQQPQYPPQTSYPAPANPWLVARIDPDPWHQRPVASEFEIQQEKDKAEEQLLIEQGADIGELSLQQDTPEKPTLINPWGQVQAIPAELTKVPCRDGDVHRLTDSCSSVVVCRNGRPQLVQCPTAQIYDRPSDSCKIFTIAKC